MQNRRPSSSLDGTAEVFAALGDRTRLYLIRKLGQAGPSSITQLSEGLEISRQAISKHLRVLEETNLVHSEKSGREQIFELDKKRFEVAQKYLESVSDRWDEAIARLKLHLEE